MSSAILVPGRDLERKHFSGCSADRPALLATPQRKCTSTTMQFNSSPRQSIEMRWSGNISSSSQMIVLLPLPWLMGMGMGRWRANPSHPRKLLKMESVCLSWVWRSSRAGSAPLQLSPRLGVWEACSSANHISMNQPSAHPINTPDGHRQPKQRSCWTPTWGIHLIEKRPHALQPHSYSEKESLCRGPEQPTPNCQNPYTLQDIHP